MTITLKFYEGDKEESIMQEDIALAFLPRKDERFKHEGDIYVVQDVLHSENHVTLKLVKNSGLIDYYKS